LALLFFNKISYIFVCQYFFMIEELTNYFSSGSIVIINIFNGLFCSALFLFVLSKIKPRLKISNSIAVSDCGQLFSFKIVNKSLLFKIYDIKVHLYSMKTCQSKNGEDEQFV